MPHRRRRKNKSRFADAPTEEGQRAQREAAFAAIRALYVESLPLWRVCGRAYCRRHHICGGDSRACIERGWPLMPISCAGKSRRAGLERWAAPAAPGHAQGTGLALLSTVEFHALIVIALSLRSSR